MGDRSSIEWTEASRSGPANNNWRGGRIVTSHGYVQLRRPGHPRADVRGYVYEHVLVMEGVLGGPLAPGERVRRRNSDPADNRPENLYLVGLRDRMIVSCACGCGAQFERTDVGGRPRIYVSGHNATRGTRVGGRPVAEQARGLPTEHRAELGEMFGGLCAYGCGRPREQWDHVVSYASGGSFRQAGNAVPVCRRCNTKKASGDPWPWIDSGMDAFPGQWTDLLALALNWGFLELEGTSA